MSEKRSIQLQKDRKSYKCTNELKQFHGIRYHQYTKAEGLGSRDSTKPKVIKAGGYAKLRGFGILDMDCNFDF